jgi:hypothetical protein
MFLADSTTKPEEIGRLAVVLKDGGVKKQRADVGVVL